MWLHHGQVQAIGGVASVVQDYADYIEAREQGQQSEILLQIHLKTRLRTRPEKTG